MSLQKPTIHTKSTAMRSTRIHVYFISLALVCVSEVLIISEFDFLQLTPDFRRSMSLDEVQQQRQQDINLETFPLVPSVSVTMDGRKEQISEKKQADPSARPFGTARQIDTKVSASRSQSSDDSRPGWQRRTHTSSRHGRFDRLLTRKECSNCTLKGRMRPPQQSPPPVMVDLPSTNQTVVDDRIIYYLHIHKSAGTTICKAAKSNGLSVSETNCNVQVDQRCCGEDDSLEAQQDFALSTDYQLVANEKEMYAAMDTEHYRYVVMLRDSRDRYESHWKHVYRRYTKKDDVENFKRTHAHRRNNEKDTVENFAGTHEHRRNDEKVTVENFTEWWTGQPDNWNVRKICGTPCMNTSKFGLTEQLWNHTVERLSQFDDVLFVDRFNESYTKFASRVGWTRMPVIQPITRDVDYPRMSDEWDPMMTALDDALYEFAEGMYQGIPFPYAAISTERRTALREYFARGREQKCNSPCCAATCSTY